MARNDSKLIGYAAKHIGASKTRSYEDRHYLGNFITAGGLDVTLAIVADGVGGGNLGQRAAELTISTVVDKIKESNCHDDEIPKMIGRAIGVANKAVYAESKSEVGKSGMSSTIALALIYQGRLFVGNVGDSRVYVVQGGKAKQITFDHTFANERVKQGLLTPEQAARHPNAHAITRSIGFEQTVTVDLGLYINGVSKDGQEAFNNQGLALNKDDVVLVCSDGLIKESHEDQKRHYVESNEIVSTVAQYHAEEAAKVLVDLAVGRNVDDNVTAVVVELPGRKISSIRKQRAFLLSGISIVLLLLLFFVWRQLVGVQDQLGLMTQANIDGTHTSIADTAIAASFTATPSPTPRPTLIPGEIGAVFQGGNRQPFLVNTPIAVQFFSEVRVNHTGEYEDGLIYLLAQSKILFEDTPADMMKFVAFPASQLFVYPGQYTAGSITRLAGAKGTVDFSVSGSCMALNYIGTKVIASCYEGSCSYQSNYGDKISIEPGTQVQFDTTTLVADSTTKIPLTEINSWLEVLPLGTHARQCVSRFVPVLPTSTDKENGTDNRTPKSTIAPTTSIGSTNSPATSPPSTQPPSTEPPPTQPPATEPPATEPPVKPTKPHKPTPTDPPVYP